MAERTGIEWCDHTFNPWCGCTKISPACDHCYAEGWAKRSGLVQWGGERRLTSDATWRQPAIWNRKARGAGKRARVFCASLADVFDNQVPDAWRHGLWDLIQETQSLDWLLLTKRPQNIRTMLPAMWGTGWPNVWLGVTAENQTEANRRIPHLLSVPARVYFLSCEPLLGPIDLGCYLGSGPSHYGGIDWIIAGGESGPQARPMHPDWARGLRDQCAAAGVPFFFKQWGEWTSMTAQGWSGQPQDPRRGPGHHTMPDGFRVFEFENGCSVGRIGKKRAGALLDGREHREVPA